AALVRIHHRRAHLPQYLAAVRNHPSHHPVPAAGGTWRGVLDAGHRRGTSYGVIRGATPRGNRAHHRDRAGGDDGDSPRRTSLAGAITRLLGSHPATAYARAAR